MTKVTLYHADWCGHCQQFKPQWETISKFLEQNGVEVASYEHGQNQKEVEAAGIQGFPTLMINENGADRKYQGPRTPDAIIREVLPNIMTGGGTRRPVDYDHEYMKYKKLYLDLKAKYL